MFKIADIRRYLFGIQWIEYFGGFNRICNDGVLLVLICGSIKSITSFVCCIMVYNGDIFFIIYISSIITRHTKTQTSINNPKMKDKKYVIFLNHLVNRERRDLIGFISVTYSRSYKGGL